MKEYNVDLSRHKATNIYNSNIEDMDLILTATVQHKKEVIDMYPYCKNKIFTMKEYVNYDRKYHDLLSIKDPWGYDLEEYRYCASEVYECIDRLIKNKLN
ncbi:Low molecular weight protein-tyrosine-phosphatase YwlE [compost metagenome]